MRKAAEEIARSVMVDAHARQYLQGFGGALTRARGMHGRVRRHALSLANHVPRQLRILAEGNGAAPADIGKFWWVEGYSQPDGPDIVPDDIL